MNGSASSSQVSKCLSDWARVKEYGGNLYTITLLRRYTPPGYELANQKAKKSVGKGKGKRKEKGKGGSNTASGKPGARFASSVNRAKAIMLLPTLYDQYKTTLADRKNCSR